MVAGSSSLARAGFVLVLLLVTFLGVAALPEVVPGTLTPPDPASAVSPPTSAPATTEGHTSSPAAVPTSGTRLMETVAPAPEPTPTFGPPPDQVEVPILMYHYVGELSPDADYLRRDLTVGAEAFEAQLQFLRDAGYHTITLADLYLHLTEGRPLPARPIILTFDDGYRDAYTVVFPLLQRYGFTGSFFVLATPAHHESPDYLTWAMVAEMADAGMEMQGHGRDHVDLRGRSYAFLVYQILGIREAVEYHTGQPVRFFCYPSGGYDEDVIAVLQSAGYWGAVSTQHGRVHTRDSLFALSRVRIRGSDALETFINKVEGRY